MKTLHDPAVRQSIETRLQSLRPDSVRQWGTMTPDQMLWHLNQFLGFALGDVPPEPVKSPMPMWLMHFFLIYMPWPKGAPTHPKAKSGEARDFNAERERCLKLIGQFVSRPIDGPWPVDAAWGKVDGKFASRLQAKHFDHHLRQFSS